MAPERGPPGMIQLVQISLVFNLEPLSEGILTVITVAFAAEFIRDMPADDCRVMSVTLSQLGVHQRGFSR